MAVFSRSLAFLTYFIAFLALATYNQVDAAKEYTITAPTATTQWVPGQPGLVVLVSTMRAKSDPPGPTEQILTITLRRDRFLGSDEIATIKDGVQLLMKPTDTQPAQLTISDFIVPASIAPGKNYFVKVQQGTGLFAPNSDSPKFEIVAAPAGNTTTALPTPTITPTTTPNATVTATPTPTLPAGQTCNDIQQQCAAQGRTYVDATATAPCTCGDNLVVPTVIRNSAPGSVKSTVKSTFQSTGGPTAALAFMLLVVMTLF